MTTVTMRQKLMIYLADADDSKVKALYTLLKEDIHDNKSFVLSEEQLEIVDRERELHLRGETKSYTRDEAMQIIKGQRDF